MSADLHLNWPAWDWLMSVAHERHVDAVVLAGDLLGCPSGFGSPEDAQRHDAHRLNECLTIGGVTVFYVMGNDDLIELNPSSAHVQSLHGRLIRWGHVTFVGYQYSLPFMGGLFEKPEAEIESDLVSLSKCFDLSTIFVSHSPAFGIFDPGVGESQIGSRAIRNFLDGRPFLAHVHGHSHEGFGRADRHFNVAADGRKRAMLLDVDAMTREVLGAL